MGTHPKRQPAQQARQGAHRSALHRNNIASGSGAVECPTHTQEDASSSSQPWTRLSPTRHQPTPQPPIKGEPHKQEDASSTSHWHTPSATPCEHTVTAVTSGASLPAAENTHHDSDHGDDKRRAGRSNTCEERRTLELLYHSAGSSYFEL
jgi:hypothetical protein